MLLVRGKLEKDDESARLVATELLPIAALKERTTREVAIHLTAPQHGRHVFEALAELLSRHRGDRRVSLELESSTSRAPTGRCASAPRCCSASGRPSGWSPRSSNCAAPDRSESADQLSQVSRRMPDMA